MIVAPGNAAKFFGRIFPLLNLALSLCIFWWALSAPWSDPEMMASLTFRILRWALLWLFGWRIAFQIYVLFRPKNNGLTDSPRN